MPNIADTSHGSLLNTRENKRSVIIGVVTLPWRCRFSFASFCLSRAQQHPPTDDSWAESSPDCAPLNALPFPFVHLEDQIWGGSAVTCQGADNNNDGGVRERQALNLDWSGAGSAATTWLCSTRKMWRNFTRLEMSSGGTFLFSKKLSSQTHFDLRGHEFVRNPTLID